jgi:hypothetical protein
MKTTIIILSIIICLLLILHFVNKNEIKSIVTYQHDTLYIVKEAEPVIIERAKTKIKYVKDTLIQTQPFVAELDTIVRQDTIYSSFIFLKIFYLLKSGKNQTQQRLNKSHIIRNTSERKLVERVNDFY